MAYVYKEFSRPHPWWQYRTAVRFKFLLPLHFFQWCAEWAAYTLSRQAWLDVLEICGSLSLLVGLIFYFLGAGSRLEQKHYQAWQVINTAQGKGGSGGRIDAMQDLNDDGVPLTGVDVRDAYLRGITLMGAKLDRANLSGVDMRGAILDNADLTDGTMIETNLRGASLQNVNLGGADLSDADLHDANLAGIRNWQTITWTTKVFNPVDGKIEIVSPELTGIKNAPSGFSDFVSQNIQDAEQQAATTQPTTQN